jgi:1,2-diacylglycerol 3-alpha-glucosyltransferase
LWQLVKVKHWSDRRSSSSQEAPRRAQFRRESTGVIPKLVIVTEIIAPYRIPVFNALAQTQKVDLRVIFLAESDPGLRQWRVYKEEIEFEYEVLSARRWRLGRHNILMNRGIFAALNRAMPDLVLSGGYNYLASWQAAGWARVHRVPLLLWSESTALDQRRGHRLVEFLKSRFLNLCSAFVVPGKSSLEYLQHLGIREQRIFTAPNAVDAARFGAAAGKVRGSEPEVRARHGLPLRYFLYVGRLVRAKGIFDLLDAYAQLSYEMRVQFGLVFVGDGADRDELMQRASRIVSGAIQFAGFAHREELPDFYALAHALVFPTYSDTWGMVVNEAMLSGLPVIATNVAGCVADLVRDGWNGFVVSPGDVSQLASAMTRLANDFTLRTEMGSKSRQRVEAYSPQAWAEGLINALEHVCARQQ